MYTEQKEKLLFDKANKYKRLCLLKWNNNEYEIRTLDEYGCWYMSQPHSKRFLTLDDVELFIEGFEAGLKIKA